MKQVFSVLSMFMLSAMTIACNPNETVFVRDYADARESFEGTGTKGNANTTNYSFRDFSSISVSGVAVVTFTQGKDYSVRVVESPRIKTIVKLKGNTLDISNESKKRHSLTLNKDQLPRVYVSAPQLSDIDISGVAYFTTKKLETGNLDVDISGAAKVSLQQVSCRDFDLDVSGAAKLEGSMKAQDADIDISGAAKVNASIHGNSVKVDNSGAAKVQLDVDCKRLKADNSGAGKLKISGTADEVKIEGSGVSKVNTSELNKI
ncbi:MAG: DUF2807 domain-containing protein [Prevotella sp.]|nr:DUF2807 domain-containing protein [Prevotella sp.]